MALTFEIQNKKIESWAQETERDIKAAGSGYGINHRANSPSPSPSLPKIKARLVMDSSAVRAVAFRFSRSLIYPHMGSGRGQGGQKGSRWVTASGIRKKTDPRSLGKAGTGNRQAKPFMNDVLNRRVPVLADIVAETSADIVTAKLFKQ